uniref:Cysteine proteinase 3 n=1 Tax=Solanum tuberosum TaxID=4113 RepID=M1CP56_SOLTU
MSRSSVLLVLIAGLFAATITGAATFADENPIRQVVVSEEVENGILQVVGESDDALSFARFVNKYGKKYESVEEIKLRFEIFVENLKMIRSHNNKRSGLSYKLGVNKFTDLTWDEFRSVKLQGTPQNCSATTKSNLKFTNVILPERVCPISRMNCCT